MLSGGRANRLIRAAGLPQHWDANTVEPLPPDWARAARLHELAITPPWHVEGEVLVVRRGKRTARHLFRALGQRPMPTTRPHQRRLRSATTQVLLTSTPLACSCRTSLGRGTEGHGVGRFPCAGTLPRARLRRSFGGTLGAQARWKVFQMGELEALCKLEPLQFALCNRGSASSPSFALTTLPR